MAWRSLSVFLLLLNIAAFAWAWFHPQAKLNPSSAVLDATPALILLTERDANAMQETAQLATLKTTAGQAEFRCSRVGPFESRDLTAELLAKLTPLTNAAQVSEQEELEIRGYWVHLPPFADREAALTAARQLSAAGVRDYYVVTAGENENSISLGLFRDAINADKRMRQVSALGFYPKRIERGDNITRYWIDYQATASAAPAIRSALPQSMAVSAVVCAGTPQPSL